MSSWALFVQGFHLPQSEQRRIYVHYALEDLENQFINGIRFDLEDGAGHARTAYIWYVFVCTFKLKIKA